MSNQDRGRPTGKQSEDYIMIGAYVRRSVFDAVKERLAAGETDFSQLVEELLDAWLAGR